MIKKYKKDNEIVEVIKYDRYSVIDEIEKLCKGKIKFLPGCNGALKYEEGKNVKYIELGNYVVKDGDGVIHIFSDVFFEKINRYEEIK